MQILISFIHWNPDPVAFSSGSLSIRWYGIFLSVGLFIAYVLTMIRFKKNKVELYHVNFLLLLAMISLAVFGRLVHVFFYDWQYYSAHISEIFKPWDGGLASHGAAAGFMLLTWIYARSSMKKSFLWLSDQLVDAAALVCALVRMGNLFNSEIVGKQSSVSWAFIFERIDIIPRHPVQLYEALSYFLLFLFLLFMNRKEEKLKTGKLTGIFLIWLFGSRFLIEFLKEDFAGVAQGWLINMGQALSIPFIILGVYLLSHKSKNDLTYPPDQHRFV